MAKRPLGITVLEAARRRISDVFDTFARVYASFSGGKDSAVLLHLTMEEAIRRKRKVGVLFIDLEGQYKLTIDFVRECYQLYSAHVEPFWVALPLSLRNAASMYEPKWRCWDSERREDWIREPDKMSITDGGVFPFFRSGMEFEEFTPAFGHWYSQGKLTACLVGIRTDESLNRFRSLMGKKSCFEGRKWTTYGSKTLYNAYPIYDWRTEDVWTYFGKTGKPWNRLYDLMRKAGLTIHQQRICQPYGDDQRKGLWLFHLIEPETWARVAARVNGANSGALYARKSGNIQGNLRISKPEGYSWESFAKLLLASLPRDTREHCTTKIKCFLKQGNANSYRREIPESQWRRVCQTLLKNDYNGRGYGFVAGIDQRSKYSRDRRVKKW